MIVLGLDTSGYANAVGVVDGGRVLSDLIFEAKSDSLEKIVANIEAALKEARLTLGDVQGIGVGLGPGSWTGIRVGVTVGKILAFSIAKPVSGVPTLAALAWQARKEAPLIYAVIGAGTGDNVYAACYRSGGDSVVRDGEYYVGGLPGLIKLAGQEAVFAGAENVLRGLGGSIRKVEAVPGGAAVARLAEYRLEKGDGDDALSLTPLYLKESAARVMSRPYRREES